MSPENRATRRIWISAAALAIGAGLFVLSACGGGGSSNNTTATTSGGGGTTTTGPAKTGGSMKLNMSNTDVDFSDPSLAYGAQSWQLEYATALKLYDYPDKPAPQGSRLVPDGADGFPVISSDGKTYTITVKKGFKFSDGAPVTAANYAYAINRGLNKKMQSPAAQFITDIVGATDVIDGKATKASGVQVDGDKLIIKLTQPDGGMLAKLGTPFFQAIPTDMPIDPKGVLTYASAGPYYWASRQVGRSIVLKKNTHYTGSRAQNVDEFNIDVNTNVNQSLLQVKAGQVDYDLGGLPPTAQSQLGAEYGVNRSQYQVHPLVETDYVALNTSRPLFSSVNMRKAANNAIDRPAMLRAFGAYGGLLTDQILPPGMGGYKRADVYPLHGPNIAVAKSLAGGKCGDLKLWASNSPTGTTQAQILQNNLQKMGCKVSIKYFQGFQIFVAAGRKGAEYDAVIAGWSQDYPDPYDFIDVLLNGNNIQAQNNNNLAYLNDPQLNAQLAAANKLTGDERYNRYGNLDVMITKNLAPWMSTDNRNQRDFVAKRVGGYLFQPANGFADMTTFYLTQ
ncbi:MAG TPA: ABC transporter substrate-binding protein [Gaiellaceae bacterium]|nr:ABC transporter substrate-binding protein [Gaiellaceae bacterium]